MTMLEPAAPTTFSEFSAPSEFDVSSLDTNLQTISAVERTWRSPALPDAVKLDLATLPEITGGGLASFLRGIDGDFQGDDEDFDESPEDFEQPVPITFEPLDQTWGRSAFDQVRVVAAGVAGEPAPTDPTVDSVKLFKKRAIELGYVEAPEDGVVDSRWSPELNSVRWEMLFDDQDRRMGGDRYGAVETNRVVDLIGDWTSPGGLLAAATDLDLWWDFDAIGDEFSSWGDKWRKVGDSSNPLDFAKNLVDAATGPLDDFVMPALNWLLLGSGVGVVSNTARVGWLASRAQTGNRMFRMLYGGARAADRAMDVRGAANATAIAQPSLTGARLARSSGSARQFVGENVMNAWRSYQPVVRAKQGMQFGMRLGVASQGQDLLPGYQGGRSFADTSVGESIQSGLRATADDPRFLPVELAFTPYNIFSPGTFLRSGGAGLNVLNRTGSGLITVAGSTLGRSAIGATIGGGAGAILGEDGGDAALGALAGGVGLGGLPAAGRVLGANTTATRLGLGALAGGTAVTLLNGDADWSDRLMGAAAGVTLIGGKSIWNRSVRKSDGSGKYIGYVSDFLQHMSYQPLADNQGVADAFHKAILRAADPGDKEVYKEAFARTGSFKEAYAAMLGVDVESASASVGYLAVSASIDRTASLQAGAGPRIGYWARYHRHRNKLVSQLRMFDMDTPASALLEDAARASAMRYADDPKRFKRVFEQDLATFKENPGKAFEYVAEHNRNARELQGQLLSSENLPDLHTPAVMTPGAEAASVLEEYLIQKAPFMRWKEFTTGTLNIDDQVAAGLFDPATLKVATHWSSGAARRADDPLVLPLASGGAVDDAVSDTVFRGANVDESKLVRSQQISPLAYTNGGRTTVAKADTRTKHEFRALADRLRDLAGLDDALRSLDDAKVSFDVIEEAAGGAIGTLDTDRIRSALQVLDLSKKQKSVERLNKFARQLGMSATDLRRHVSTSIDEIANDQALWASYNLDRFVQEGADHTLVTGVDALRARLKQLDEGAQYTAAEIDTDALIRYWDEVDPAKAEEVRTLVEGLERDGYKLVHGVEYLMPHDLLKSNFADMTKRNMHAATLGNYFRGRLPGEARAIEERRQRLALAEKLQDRAGETGLRPDDDLVGDLLGDLRLILEDEQARASELVDNIRDQRIWQRKATAIQSMATPLRLEDLQGRKSLVIDRLQAMGWTKEQAEAAFTAIPKFRNAEFRDLGLYALEAKLRQRNELVQGLKFLSGTKHGDGLLQRSTTGAAVGGFTGMAYGASAASDSDEESLGRRLAYGAAGAVAGGAAQAALKPLDKLIPAAELMSIGYLGDKFARARDSLRFSLSPFFDISRYTEGMMLAQTAAPLRKADGSRLVLPLDMSPRGVRRHLRKGLQAAGKSKEEARSLAQSQFDQYRHQFRQAASGDFDPEVLDSAGKWFSQVGIMGFNPTDWMTGAFAQLRMNDIDPEAAYKAVREMYTYGTTGRSAAELTTNFVFFPFSFQKKALGHMAKWMSDDLSRSIMIHDAFKAYEILDEKHDLESFWEDHIPVLNQLGKLNLLNFGISPGRLGGINAPYLEAGFKATMGLFTPQGVSIRNAADAAELEDVMRSLTPAINDINWMLEDLKEQGHVLMSESHLTTRAEVRAGYDEWNEYKRSFEANLAQQGFTLSDIRRKPYLSDLQINYEMKRAEIGDKYPSWSKNRVDSVYNRIALNMEKADRLSRAEMDPESAVAGDLDLYEMETMLAALQQDLRYRGYDVGGDDGWVDAPSNVFDYVLAEGVRRLEADPRFGPIWDKFYRDEFGPLEAQI